MSKQNSFTNLTTRSKQRDIANLTTRSIQLRASTVNEANRTVEAVIATESRVRVLDRTAWREIEEILLMSGAQLPDQLVLLDAHDRYSRMPIWFFPVDSVTVPIVPFESADLAYIMQQCGDHYVLCVKLKRLLARIHWSAQVKFLIKPNQEIQHV